MVGRNFGICHSCRAKIYFFNECFRKRRCPLCKFGFEKRFVVEKESVNKGKLFVCCSNKCGFWSWVVTDNLSDVFSNVGNVGFTEVNVIKNEIVDEMFRMFEFRVRLTDEEEFKISVDVTIRMEKVSVVANAKGKGKASQIL